MRNENYIYKQLGKMIREFRVDRGISQENLAYEATLSAFKDFDRIWDQSSFEKKKDLTNTLIEKVIYTKGKLSIEYNTAI